MFYTPLWLSDMSTCIDIGLHNNRMYSHEAKLKFYIFYGIHMSTKDQVLQDAFKNIEKQFGK